MNACSNFMIADFSKLSTSAKVFLRIGSVCVCVCVCVCACACACVCVRACVCVHGHMGIRVLPIIECNMGTGNVGRPICFQLDFRYAI